MMRSPLPKWMWFALAALALSCFPLLAGEAAEEKKEGAAEAKDAPPAAKKEEPPKKDDAAKKKDDDEDLLEGQDLSPEKAAAAKAEADKAASATAQKTTYDESKQGVDPHLKLFAKNTP